MHVPDRCFFASLNHYGSLLSLRNWWRGRDTPPKRTHLHDDPCSSPQLCSPLGKLSLDAIRPEGNDDGFKTPLMVPQTHVTRPVCVPHSYLRGRPSTSQCQRTVIQLMIGLFPFRSWARIGGNCTRARAVGRFRTDEYESQSLLILGWQVATQSARTVTCSRPRPNRWDYIAK